MRASATRAFLIAQVAAGLCLALAMCACDGREDLLPKGERAEVWAAVNGVRQDLARSLGRPVPSLNVLVQTPEGIAFASATDNPEAAVGPDTFFRFASNTKMFTAAAVLLMHQEGLLDIKDRITDPIPGAAVPYTPSSAQWDIPYKGRITIEQLLNHSAGVYDVDNDPVPGCGGESFTAWMLAREPAHQFTAGEMVGQGALHRLSYFEPGAGYHYSNTGYAILGEIVARVYSAHAGEARTYADYLRDKVVGGSSPVPLPVHFPWRARDTGLPEPHACGRIYGPNGPMTICRANMSAQVAEGNGYGTMAALNRFVRTLMRGENVLDPATAERMRADSSAANPLYSLGCDYRANLGYGHNGARVGNLSFMAYNPETGVSVVAYLPMWDLTRGMDSFKQCFTAMYKAAYAALEALGYPGSP